MNLKECEYCFKCGKPTVFAEHRNNVWKIKCITCGIDTRVCKTHKEARADWEQLKSRDKE